MQTLFIRADAGSQMGTGHVMRCLALAQAWRDTSGDVVYVMAQSSLAVEERLRAEGVKIISTHSTPGSAEDAREVVEAAQVQGGRWIVVDGYQFGAEYQKHLKEAELKVLFVDDTGHAAHYSADLVLNQNAHASADIYGSRDPDTRLVLGPRYALLRREFSSRRNFRREIPPVARRVLVTMGGSDPENLTLRAIEALALTDVEGLEATVVIGGSNPHMKFLREPAGKSGKPIRLLSDVRDMAEWMIWADVAISAAGSTCWEMCLFGLPMLLIDFAPNQTPVARELDRVGAALHLGNTANALPETIANQLRKLLNARDSRVSMSQKAAELVDGRGAERVVAAIRSASLRLRRVEMQDCQLLWAWAKDPDVRRASFSPEPISWTDHAAWFSNRLADEKTSMFIAEDRGAPVGQIRLDRTRDHEAEIDVSVAREKRGAGYASLLIESAVQVAFFDAGLLRLHAFIRPANLASLRAFERANFRRAETIKVKDNEAVHYVRDREGESGAWQ